MKLTTWASTTGVVALTATLLAMPLSASAAPSSALSTDDTSSASSECTFGEHLVTVWLGMPSELRSDLTELGRLEPGTRGPAAREIRDAALAGEYGSGVQDRAETARERGIRVIVGMPEELRSDLKELRSADSADRAELARAIGEAAIDGDYGAKTQAIAERVQSSELWQNCVAE